MSAYADGDALRTRRARSPAGSRHRGAAPRDFVTGDAKTLKELAKALEAWNKHDPKLEKRPHRAGRRPRRPLRDALETGQLTAAALAGKGGEIAQLRRELEEGNARIEVARPRPAPGGTSPDVAELRKRSQPRPSRPSGADDRRVDAIASDIDVLSQRLDTLSKTVSTTAAALAGKEGELASLRSRLEDGDARRLAGRRARTTVTAFPPGREHRRPARRPADGPDLREPPPRPRQPCRAARRRARRGLGERRHDGRRHRGERGRVRRCPRPLRGGERADRGDGRRARDVRSAVPAAGPRRPGGRGPAGRARAAHVDEPRARSCASTRRRRCVRATPSPPRSSSNAFWMPSRTGSPRSSARTSAATESPGRRRFMRSAPGCATSSTSSPARSSRLGRTETVEPRLQDLASRLEAMEHGQSIVGAEVTRIAAAWDAERDALRATSSRSPPPSRP